MLPYWLLLGLFSVGAIYFEGRRLQDLPVLPMVLASAFTAIMIGLRYEVGSDWEPYRLIFWEIRFSSLGEAILRSDPSYGLLNWLVRRAGLDLWAVNLACGAIFMVGLHRFARRQASPWLVMAAATPYLIIVVGMGYNRQATALGLALLALNAIQVRKFGWFLGFMLLAATFHRSSLLLLPIVALSYSHNRLLTGFLAALATGIGYFFIVAPEVDTYISRYGGAEQGAIESQGTVVRVLMNLLPAILFFGFRARFPANAEYTKIWRNFSFFALVSLAALVYFGNNTAVDRLSIYLVPLQLFVLGNLPSALGGGRGTSRLATMLIVSYAAVIQVVWLMLASNAKFWLPYRLFPL